MTRPTALALALILAACSESSRQPPITPGQPTPGAFTNRLELTGPDTVYVGQAVQFTVTSHLTDGTTKNVTKEVTWRTVNSHVLTMSEAGLFTGKAKGETPISVALGGITATMSDVVVVPEGTFRLKGTVRDAGIPVDATVRIESPPLGRVELPTQHGQFVVYGVAGDTEVKVEKSGYQEERIQRTVATHSEFAIDLRLSGSREVVAGQYRLTVTAGPECGGLPADVQSRSYSARIEQAGPALTVILDGAQFVTSSGQLLNRFTGFLESDRASFNLAPAFDDSSWYYYYFYNPDILETLGDGSSYSFDGRVIADVEPNGLAGRIEGNIVLMKGPPYVITSRCRSSAHGFALTKATQ